MKYFVTEDERKAARSTCYFEFQKGCHSGECWLPDSINIPDIQWDAFRLEELIRRAGVDFDYFGPTMITREQWNEIVRISREGEAVWEEVVAEAAPWVSECFQEYDRFTIMGM